MLNLAKQKKKFLTLFLNIKSDTILWSMIQTGNFCAEFWRKKPAEKNIKTILLLLWLSKNNVVFFCSESLKDNCCAYCSACRLYVHMCQLQLYTHSMNTSLHYCGKAHARGRVGGVGASGGSITGRACLTPSGLKIFLYFVV